MRIENNDKYYILSDKEVQHIITSLTCTLLSNIPPKDRTEISSLINYFVKGGK